MEHMKVHQPIEKKEHHRDITKSRTSLQTLQTLTREDATARTATVKELQERLKRLLSASLVLVRCLDYAAGWPYSSPASQTDGLMKPIPKDIIKRMP